MSRRMKDSGIEWIGEIPEEWDVAKFKNISDLYVGNSIKDNEKDNYMDNNNSKHYVSTKDIVQEKNIIDYSDTLYIHNEDNNFRTAPKGSSLICIEGGSAGRKKAFLDRNVCFVNKLCCINPFENINGKYIYYLISNKSFEKEFDKYIQGLIGGVSVSKLSNFKVPYPKSEEQDRIVHYLDRKISKINLSISSIQNQVTNLEDYKKSIITEAVTKGLDKNVEMKDSGIEWIGKIPKHWKLIKLKFVADLISKGISPNYVSKKITPVVNQATFSKGYFDYNLKYCSDKPIGEALLQENDVLIATTGGGVLGKTHFFEEKDNYLASTDVAFMRTNNKYISKFIYYLLSVNYDLLNGEYAKGSTNQTHLQMGMLKDMNIPLPNRTDLKNIIFKLDYVDKTINDSISIKRQQLETLEEYKKSLIYEYVTGKKEVKDV